MLNGPLTCPTCEKPLIRVRYTMYGAKLYQDGEYVESTEWPDQDMTVDCPHCDADLSKVLPEEFFNLLIGI